MVKKIIQKRAVRKQISVSVSQSVLAALERIAEQERRSVSGQAEFFLTYALSRNITEGSGK